MSEIGTNDSGKNSYLHTNIMAEPELKFVDLKFVDSGDVREGALIFAKLNYVPNLKPVTSSIPKNRGQSKVGKGIWYLLASWIHLALILSTMLCVSNAVKGSYIHDINADNFLFKSIYSPSNQKNTTNFYHNYSSSELHLMTSGRFFVNGLGSRVWTESLSLPLENNFRRIPTRHFTNSDMNVTFSISMNNMAIYSQQLLLVSSNEELVLNASATLFPYMYNQESKLYYFWRINNGESSLLNLLTTNSITQSVPQGLVFKVNTNDLLPSIPYNFNFVVQRVFLNDNSTLESSFSFIMERKYKSNVIAQINGGLHEEYLPIHSYKSRSHLKESEVGSIIQSDGSVQLFSTSYDPENLPLVDFVKETFNWTCFYIKGHSYNLSGKSQLKSDISSLKLLPCKNVLSSNTESYYKIPISHLEYYTSYVVCLTYSVGTRSDMTFTMLRTLNINENWSVRIFPSTDTFMDLTKAIVMGGDIFPGGILLSGITSLKWEWSVSYLGQENQPKAPTIIKQSSSSVLYLEPRTLLSNEKPYSSSPNIYEFSVKAIINQQYTVNSTFRRKVASKQQDNILKTDTVISVYPLMVGYNRPLLDKFVIEFPGIVALGISTKYEIYYTIPGDSSMKLLTTVTYLNKITTWLPYSRSNQIDIHIFALVNDPLNESNNFRYWLGTRNVKLDNTDNQYLGLTLEKIQQLQNQVVNTLPNIKELMKKNNLDIFEPRIITDIYLDLDKLCTTLNELYEVSAIFNTSEEGMIREKLTQLSISTRDQLQTLNRSNIFSLSVFEQFNMNINLIQLIVSLTKKPLYLSARSASFIGDSLLHPLLTSFLKERNLFITRSLDVIDMRPATENYYPIADFSSLFSTYSNSFLTILDSLLSTPNTNTIVVKSQVLAGFCQKWIHQLSSRLVEESAPSTSITISNNNVEISYKRDLLSSLVGAGFGEGASVSVDYSNDTREWKVNNNLLLIQLPPEIRQQSLFISDIETSNPPLSERSLSEKSLDESSIISPLPLNISDQFVGFKIVTFKNMEGNSQILGNVMISVELLYNQQPLKLRDLKSPIEMVFFADQSVYLPNYLWMGGGCHFWNETTEDWSKEGCKTVASYSFLGNTKPKDSLITDNSNPGLNRIYCSCNHTTLFAVLKANTSDVELIEDFTNKVWGDITSCILILVFSVGQAIFLLSIRTPHNIALKFRGFIPFFGILVLVLEALINLARDGMVMNVFLTGVEIPLMDTIDGALRTVIDPLYCAMLVLYMLNVWQYYHKERFQYLMKKYQEKDEKYSIRRYVKFTSRSYLVMPCLTLYAAQLVTYIILLVLASVSVLNFKLVFTVLSLVRACLIALSVIVSFSIIIFMELFVKKMLNFNDVKTDNFLKFEGTFNGDVFLFKIEWIAYMFMASLIVLAEGYDVMNVMYPNLYSNTFNEGSLAFQLYSRQAHIHMLEIAPIILLFMVKLLILLVYGGFVACMTARKHTFCCTVGSETQNTSDSELFDVVNDPVLGPLFEYYAMKEFTLPLVYLYRQLVDIYSFEGNFHQSMFERSQHVRKIYKRFLKKYSPFPLSISRKTMRMFHIRKEQDEAITAQELEDLVTILKVETTEQLMGVYWRFKQTEAFKKNEKKSVANPYLNEDL